MPKRDMERMREILLCVEGDALEEFGDGSVWARHSDFFVEGDNYQITLLEQAGFLETFGQTTASVVSDRLRITFDGHDYLDTIRDSGIWEKTKNAVVETGGSASVEVIKALATGFLKKKLSKHTGIDL